ncbi:MAG: hypothetical protein AAB368_04380, partial [bacterium]
MGKFQRFYFDLSGIASADRNAVTRLTYRFADGVTQGGNFWFDDIRAGGAYMTTPAGVAITSSVNRYIQYRAILSTNNTGSAAPYISSVTVNYSLPAVGSSSTIISTATTAKVTPIKVNFAGWINLGASGTATAAASRDNGTTWTQIPLTLQATETGSIKIYSGNTDISSQPTGTAMRWKVTLTVDAKLYASGLWWEDNLKGGGSGLYTNNGTIANNGYVEVVHNQNTSDVIVTGWIYNTSTLKWDKADATSSLYKIELTTANTVRLYNYTGISQTVRLDVMSGDMGRNRGTVSLAPEAADVDAMNSSNSIFISKTGTGGNFINLQNGGTNVLSVNLAGNFTSGVADSSTANAFLLNTSNTLANASARLLSVQNNGTEKMYLDASGNLYVSGNIITNKGSAVSLVNKWQNSAPTRSLVGIDVNNNAAFTGLTVDHSTKAIGVLQGVTLGGDTDADGACALTESCAVVLGGSVKVLLSNAASATRGDYVYASTTAGTGYASSVAQDGILGVVTDISTAGSGYVTMIVRAQAISSSGSPAASYDFYQADITNIALGHVKEQKIESVTYQLLEKGAADGFMSSSGVDAGSSSANAARSGEGYYYNNDVGSTS